MINTVYLQLEGGSAAPQHTCTVARSAHAATWSCCAAVCRPAPAALQLQLIKHDVLARYRAVFMCMGRQQPPAGISAIPRSDFWATGTSAKRGSKHAMRYCINIKFYVHVNLQVGPAQHSYTTHNFWLGAAWHHCMATNPADGGC